ncbi:PKD domain-containing protein [Methanocaldococcus indicus]|uniref:PKD domain-containing protein n=1 Tax=Methanocaldococcus indicus TaxID=213231 RepID=UPI003C6D0372
MKKGQVSLELIILILGVIIGGAVLTVQVAKPDIKFLGNATNTVKKEAIGYFVYKPEISPISTNITEEQQNTTTNTTNTTKKPIADFEYYINLKDKYSFEFVNRINPGSGKPVILKIDGKSINLRDISVPYSGIANTIEFKVIGKATILIDNKSYHISGCMVEFVGNLEYNITHETNGNGKSLGQYYIEIKGDNASIYIWKGSRYSKHKIVLVNGEIKSSDEISNVEVIFDASKSYSPNGEIVKYIWNFGDGSKEETTTPIITHTYTPGTYNVTLTVVDNKNLTSSITKTVVINISETQPITVKLPDLIPYEVNIIYNNGTKYCHRWEEQVKNHGENQESQNQFRHRCKNNTNVEIEVVVKNIGNASASKFYVGLRDNNYSVDSKEIDSLGVDETKTVIFDYTISTSKCCKCECEEYNHTLAIYVDYNNLVNESNEDNNIMYITFEIEKGCCHNNENTNITNNTPIYNNINLTNNTNLQPADVEGLYIKVNGYGDLEFYKEPLTNAVVIGPNIYIKIPGGDTYIFNLNGVINNGRIKVNGNGNLILGNIKSINNLYLRLEGNSNIDFDDVPNIYHIYFISNDGFNSLSPELGEIVGDVNVNLKDKYISTIKATIINGNAELVIDGGIVNDINIEKIISNGVLEIKNSIINNLNINENNGEIILINSKIGTINVNNNGTIIIKDYSEINSGNINNDGDIEKDSTSIINANINH